MERKEISLNVHSVVDQITNSSTEIFITAKDDAAEIVEKFINKVLEAVGVTSKAKDICKISVKDQYSMYGFGSFETKKELKAAMKEQGEEEYITNAQETPQLVIKFLTDKDAEDFGALLTSAFEGIDVGNG